MSGTDLIAASKFMSLVLRHKPETIGLELDAEGWASVADLVAGSGGRLSEEIVRRIVAESEKQRFAMSPDGTEIRANQGHSIAVDLGLEPREPPARLFHGTAARFLGSIRAAGLEPRSRQYVHLSVDAASAEVVGARHGTPVVLIIDSAGLHRDGHALFLSRNGVWLTEAVSARYIGFGEHPAG